MIKSIFWLPWAKKESQSLVLNIYSKKSKSKKLAKNYSLVL